MFFWNTVHIISVFRKTEEIERKDDFELNMCGTFLFGWPDDSFSETLFPSLHDVSQSLWQEKRNQETRKDEATRAKRQNVNMLILSSKESSAYMDAKVWVPKPMMATFVACANWLYIYSQFLVGSDGFPSHGNLLYIWYILIWRKHPALKGPLPTLDFTCSYEDFFLPGVIGRIGLELPKFWAMCRKETSLLQRLWLLQRNISRSCSVSTAKMMSGSQHSRWVFQSWHRPQRCSEKLWRKQTCMCKCRLQRTCGVTSKTSPGVLYYLLFTLDLNGKISPYFLDQQNILDSASQQKSHPQTRGSRCLGPPGRGTVPSKDRKCGKGGGFLAKRDLAVSKCCF